MNPRIIIYSNRESSLTADQFEKSGNSETQIDFCANVSSLIARLNLNEYSSCIIDSDLVENGSHLLEVLRHLIDFNLPILIKGLNHIQLDSTYNDSRNSNVPEKLNDPKLIRLLAATVNHEINSPLQAVSANVELLKASGDNLNVSTIDKLNNIDRATGKIRRVMHGLLELNEINYKKTAAGKMIDIFNQNKTTDRSNLEKIMSE